MLSADASAHRQDTEIARHIAAVALTERISQTTLARLSAQFRSSPQTFAALTILAKQSEFLDPPADELLANPAPDGVAQQRLLQIARQYVADTLRGLPNFLATRTINLYDDRPQPAKPGEWPTRSGLHMVGTSSAEISVTRERDDQPPAQSSAVWESKFGLVSGGEFGTTLGMILAETTAGNVTWSHWEKGEGGVLAIFRYSVPASASHFEVISSYQREASVEGTRSARDARGVSGIELRPNASSNNIQVVRSRPAYHGFISLDPASGTVYRVTMEADMNKGLPFRRAAILVEYGPVDIAGARFVCPLRSLAISEAQTNAQTIVGSAVTEWLNETLFTDYHRFGSSSRVVTQTATTEAPGSAPATANAEQNAPRAAEASAATQGSTEPAPASAATAAPAISPTAPAIAPQPDSSSNSATAADIPSFAPPAAPDDLGYSLRMDVNSLLIPAVVLDKSGRSIAGLAKEDFVVLDNGRRQAITGFTPIGRAQASESRGPEGEASSPDRAPRVPSSAAARNRFVIFLFDDRHMSTDELPFVQKAAGRVLEKPLPDHDYAAVLSFMGVNSGITHDHAVLQAAVTKLAVHHALQHDREDCPDVDYYSADQIVRQHNATEFQIAVEKARKCSMLQVETRGEDPYIGMNNPNDPFQRAAMAAAARALAMGEEDARQSLAPIRTVVRAMSKLPGERVLILVSSGFLTLSPETMKLKSEIMDLAATSDVIINTLDARGLYAGNLDASQGGSTSTIAMVTNELGQNRLASMQAGENAMAELAAGTAGRFFHNNNDLLGGLESLAGVPENSYLLEISLKDVKANGALHRLQVKVDKPGLGVLARKGYVAPSASSGKKGSAPATPH